MVNAWSLLYDEYYGTMNETFPVKKEEEPVAAPAEAGSGPENADQVHPPPPPEEHHIVEGAARASFLQEQPASAVWSSPPYLAL